MVINIFLCVEYWDGDSEWLFLLWWFVLIFFWRLGIWRRWIWEFFVVLRFFGNIPCFFEEFIWYRNGQGFDGFLLFWCRFGFTKLMVPRWKNRLLQIPSDAGKELPSPQSNVCVVSFDIFFRLLSYIPIFSSIVCPICYQNNYGLKKLGDDYKPRHE